MRKALKLICTVVFHAPPVPAKNRWTKMEPALSQLPLMACFGNGLLLRAHQRMMRSRKRERNIIDDVASDEVDGWGQVHGVKSQMRSKRATRTFQFLARCDTPWTLLTCLCMAQPLFKLHYQLFKCATWASHVKVSEHDKGRVGIRAFAAPEATNLGQQTLAALQDRLQEDAACWDVVWEMPDPPDKVMWRSFVQPLLLVACSKFWRSVVDPFRRYPWLLVELVSEEVSESQKKRRAKHFMQVSECCLDRGFSLRLRSMIRCWKDLLQPPLQNLLWVRLAQQIQ